MSNETKVTPDYSLLVLMRKPWGMGGIKKECQSDTPYCFLLRVVNGLHILG
jgi:hypothetical protein